MMVSTLVTVVIVILIVGLAVYLIDQKIPIAQPFKTAIYVVIVIGLLVWGLYLAGGGRVY